MNTKIIELFQSWFKGINFFVFVGGRLKILTFLCLGFGFLVVLIEMRLPLKYYWELPIFMLKKILEGLRILRSAPVWGFTLDSETRRTLPLTVVELLDEATKGVIRTTYSNRLGQYGFKAPPGRYILRAIKNEYLMPSVLDPENIELIEIKESYALPVRIKGDQRGLQINLDLLPLEKFDPKDPKFLVRHYVRSLVLNLANALLALGVLSALLGWTVMQEPVFGILLATGIVFLFIKLYILETVATLASVK